MPALTTLCHKSHSFAETQVSGVVEGSCGQAVKAMDSKSIGVSPRRKKNLISIDHFRQLRFCSCEQ